MKSFGRKNGIRIGGSYNTDLTNIPSDDNFFDIAVAIGVLEYFTLEYSRRALQELHRVLKPAAKMVLDVPNLMHPFIETLFRLEEYFKRPNVPKDKTTLEDLIQTLFEIDCINDSQVMLKYFVRKVE